MSDDDKLPIDILPREPQGWTSHDTDPAVRAAALAIRKALLPLTPEQRNSALFLADFCPDCGGDNGGQRCCCMADD